MPRAEAAHFLPTHLAAAGPRCLPCRLLVSLIRQGDFGGPSASSSGGLSSCHLWAKAGSLLSSSPSAPAVWLPGQKQLRRQQSKAAPSRSTPAQGNSHTAALGPLRAHHRALRTASSDLTMAALMSRWGSPRLSRAGTPCGLPWGNTAAALLGSGSPCLWAPQTLPRSPAGRLPGLAWPGLLGGLPALLGIPGKPERVLERGLCSRPMGQLLPAAFLLSQVFCRPRRKTQ